MDDFGGKLRQARERRGISLRQIASSTKIAAAALEALEKNDVSKLPGGIFSRAFVRSYAVEVGLDPDDTVREFLDRFNQDPAPSSTAAAAAILPEEERQFEHRQRRAIKVLAIGAGLLAILIAVSYVVWRGRTPGSVSAQTPPTATAVEPAPAPVPQPAPLPAADAAPPVAPPPAGELTIEVHPVAACWVSLTVDGRKLFGRVMQAGEREKQIVQREAIVEIGDAGAFAYSVNGLPGKPLGEKGQVKTMRLTPATAAEYQR